MNYRNMIKALLVGVSLECTVVQEVGKKLLI
jgi:hypothetical protein